MSKSSRGLKRSNFCSFNCSTCPSSKDLGQEPGIPELETLYKDQFDYQTGELLNSLEFANKIRDFMEDNLDIVFYENYEYAKKLNYLIIGEKPTKRKVDTAKELKIKIINQKDLSKLLYISS